MSTKLNTWKFRKIRQRYSNGSVKFPVASNLIQSQLKFIIMPTTTNIEWADKTWNPATGCTKISPGCTHCYAEAIYKRFNRGNFSNIKIHSDRLDVPRHWRKPRKIFVNSMSDLFHESIPVAFIQSVFKIMNECNWHSFQVLTKRASRLVELAPELNWSPNIWMGVSVEKQFVDWRIDDLRKVPAAIRFLSCEPLLGELNLDLSGIHWVIAGGESGDGHRYCNPEWIRSIRDQCLEAEVPFFFKQWGGRTPKRNGRTLDGVEWSQFPESMSGISL
jgi:protein gp37